MANEEQFQKAAEDVKKLAKTPTDDELLEIYALYKQATVGDVNTARPGMLEFKAKAKWDAWNAKKGMSTDAAKDAYVAKVKQLIEAYGSN